MTMKVIVVSDTHMPKRAKKLPKRLIEDLGEADLIIHAGDWQTIEVYEELSKCSKKRFRRSIFSLKTKIKLKNRGIR